MASQTLCIFMQFNTASLLTLLICPLYFFDDAQNFPEQPEDRHEIRAKNGSKGDQKVMPSILDVLIRKPHIRNLTLYSVTMSIRRGCCTSICICVEWELKKHYFSGCLFKSMHRHGTLRLHIYVDCNNFLGNPFHVHYMRLLAKCSNVVHIDNTRLDFIFFFRWLGKIVSLK